MKAIFAICCVLISSTATAQGLRKMDSLACKQPVTTFTTFAIPYAAGTGQFIPQDYYTRRFGFFCRQELKMRQAHIPVTFRLGSMEYCNRLEQKPGYR